MVYVLCLPLLFIYCIVVYSYNIIACGHAKYSQFNARETKRVQRDRYFRTDNIWFELLLTVSPSVGSPVNTKIHI
jgi:hypothetical protein